jgi:hypothetical protein
MIIEKMSFIKEVAAVISMEMQSFKLRRTPYEASFSLLLDILRFQKLLSI